MPIVRVTQKFVVHQNEGLIEGKKSFRGRKPTWKEIKEMSRMIDGPVGLEGCWSKLEQEDTRSKRKQTKKEMN